MFSLVSNQERRDSAAPNRPQTASDVDFPVSDPECEARERESWRALGQSCARQEDWEQVAVHMSVADATGALTDGGIAVADLIAEGARADVVDAVSDALADGPEGLHAQFLTGIECFEDVLEESDHDPGIAVIVARSHLDIGLAWRDTETETGPTQQSHDAFHAHLDRAAQILTHQCKTHSKRASLWSACCDALSARRTTAAPLPRVYQKLIDLNPRDTRHLRGLGRALLPETHGSSAPLTKYARRTADRLNEIWGAGGYAWVMLDAAATDAQACADLDLAYFEAGFRDILAHDPSQARVNMLAAYCALTMGGDTGAALADHNRGQVRSWAEWIIRDHLTELHPLIWAEAAREVVPQRRNRTLDYVIAKGAHEARKVINAFFETSVQPVDALV